MPTQVPLQCRCGQVRALASNVALESGSHIVCMCDDCQAYARFLQREDILDEHGGTAIYQMTPAQLRFTQGQEQLRSMQLFRKGMTRWYCGCCNTPVANTLRNAKVPFVGMPLAFVDWGREKRSAQQLFGAPVKLMAQFAKNGPVAGAHDKIPPAFLLRALFLLGRAYLRGQSRPSPFFLHTGAPSVEPKILSREERAALSAQ